MDSYQRVTAMLVILILILLAFLINGLHGNMHKAYIEKEIQRTETENTLSRYGKIEYIGGEAIIKFDDHLSSYTYSLTNSKWVKKSDKNIK